MLNIQILKVCQKKYRPFLSLEVTKYFNFEDIEDLIFRKSFFVLFVAHKIVFYLFHLINFFMYLQDIFLF